MKTSGVQNEARISAFHRNAFAFFSLLILILAAYSNSFHASWHLDDEPNITQNTRVHITKLSWPQMRDALLSTPSVASVPFFRPVSRFSIALNYYLGRDEVFGYHVVNVLIHFSASFFLYLFITSTLKLPFLRTEYGPHSFFISLLAASLWAVHPIQTQAVTYIVQRMTSMAGMFQIMAMYFYTRSRCSSGKSTRIILLILSAFIGLLALGSKENALLLPLSLFVFDTLLVNGHDKNIWKRNLKILCLLYLLPLLAMTVYLQISHDVIARVFALYETRPFTPLERLLTQPRALVFYLTLLLYPMPDRLSIDHDITTSVDLFTPPSTIPSMLLIIAMIVWACLQARKRPLVAFSVIFFFLNHLMESTILPMEQVFEHRNYLPSMLFFVPIAVWLVKGVFSFPNRRSMLGIIAVFDILVLAAFAHSTYLRNAAWQSEKTLWEDVLEKYPDSFRAHNNLGKYYTLRGEEGKAVQEYQRALASHQTQRRSEKAIALFNLGYIAHMKGDRQKALSFYKKALGMEPCYARAYNNLAALLLEAQDYDRDAVCLLEKALDCRNKAEIPSALANMGLLFLKIGNQVEALKAFQQSLDIDPDDPLTLSRVGDLLKEKDLSR